MLMVSRLLLLPVWRIPTAADESLLSKLACVRGLALNIPAGRNDILGPINSVIDALWDLEERLRYWSVIETSGNSDA